MELDVFLNEWQRVAVDKAAPHADQASDLLAYVESLEVSFRPGLTSRGAAAVHAQQAMAAAWAARPRGEKHERIFDTIEDALGFAALVNGVAYFWTSDPGFKVVWYTYNNKEVS